MRKSSTIIGVIFATMMHSQITQFTSTDSLKFGTMLQPAKKNKTETKKQEN